MAKSKQVKCEAEESDDDVSVSFTKMKHVTSKAVLVVAYGDDTWIPFNQLVEFDEENKEMTITHWIAERKGLN